MSAPFEIKFPTKKMPWDHPNPLVISDSSIGGTWDYCKRLFEFYKLYEAPRSKEDEKGHMAVGHAMHRGWQTWMITRDQDAAIWEMMRSHPVRIISQAEDEKSLEACYATLVKAMNHVQLAEYQIAEVKCIDGVVRPAVEVEFELWLENVTIMGRPVVYIGFIDCILFSVLTDLYTVVDVKSMGPRKRETNFVAEYMHKGQGLPYGLVIQHVANLPMMEYVVMYLPMVIDLTDPHVQPIPIKKTATDVRDWYTGLYFKMKQLKEFSQRDYFPRREDGCNAYGRYPCRYLQICNSRKRDEIQKYLLSEYEEPQKPKERKPWIRLMLKMPEDLAA